MKRIILVLAIAISMFLFTGSPPISGQEQKAAEWKGKLADGTVVTHEDLTKILEEHEKWIQSRGKEGQKADLRWADLGGVDLKDADLKGANLEGADVSFADFGRAFFEPSNIEDLVFSGARDLSSIRFNNFSAVVDLRKVAKESGLRNEERALTAALRKYRMVGARSHERIFEYIFLDLSTDSGANPWRSLEILGLLILVFSIPYLIAVREPGKDGIWKTWIPERMRKDLGEQEPKLLNLRGWEQLRVGLYFSVLSAFNIGWRELNIGNWIARLQPREYTLRASGWVRSVSGIQSLISVYLIVMWLLTYFGRPFE